MLGKKENTLDKNNYVQTSLVKPGGWIEVTVYVLPISGLREKHKHRDTQYQAQEHPPKNLQLQEKSVETGSKLWKRDHKKLFLLCQNLQN